MTTAVGECLWGITPALRSTWPTRSTKRITMSVTRPSLGMLCDFLEPFVGCLKLIDHKIAASVCD